MTDKITTDPNETSLVVLNQANAMNVTSYGKERKLLSLGHLWHKILVHNAGPLDREFVLKTILNAVHPLDLIPVNYKVEGTNSHFMARNCGAAIEKLCRDNLIVRNPDGKSFILTVILGISNTTRTQLNVQGNILNTITKRYNRDTKTLNLDRFHKDPDLSELIFCSLSQPKILYFVLHLSKSKTPTTLKLTRNELRILSPMEVLWSIRNLTSLDLRNNLIENMDALIPLKSMKITDLHLDGNPVCQNYDEAGYIEAVKEVCPTIEKLDGTVLSTNGFLAYRRNFVCENSSAKFIDQFLAHYFTLYDHKDRMLLDGLYHPEAMFSISCSYLNQQVTSSTVRLERYKKSARNLIKLSDLSRSAEQLTCGSENVLRRLCSLPPSEHDPYTFTVDVPHFRVGASVVLHVSGAFREPATSVCDQEALYGFSRTFVLVGAPRSEYLIVNEMLHVTNASSSLANRAFKIVRVPTGEAPGMIMTGITLPSHHKGQVVQAFCKITTLTQDIGKKMLVESSWDIQKALQQFVDLYKIEKLPKNAFART